jgi:BASS family bile acid:Na+ symporter
MSAFDLVILLATWLLMMAVGLGIEWRRARELKSGLVVATLGAHIIFVPLIGLGLAYVCGLGTAVGAALLLLAASPVGDIVGFYTLVGRGNVPLAVALNAVTCALAPVSMGAFFFVCQLWMPEEGFAAPGWMLVLRLLGLVLVPIGIGLLVRLKAPAVAARLLAVISPLAGAGVLLVLAWALVRQWDEVVRVSRAAFPAAFAFLAAGLGFGAMWARLWRLDPADALAVAVTFPVRNAALAVALATTVLDRPDFVAFCAIYFLVEAPLFLLGARVWRSVVGRTG